MSRDCIKSGPAVLLLVLLLGLPASAQDMRDIQLFGPSDLSTYVGGSGPNEGYFFKYDGLYWSISAPRAEPIGKPGKTRNVYYNVTGGASPPDQMAVQRDSFSTAPFTAKFVTGQRVELGRVEGHHGFLVSGYWLNKQGQSCNAQDVSVVFEDLAFGPDGESWLQGPVWGDGDGKLRTEPECLRNLPVTFDEMTISNRVNHWSIEWMYLHRFRPMSLGGFFEFFAGVRYLEFDERFKVDATGGILADSNWNTSADNHVVGPQLGARWANQRGRWTLNTEGRFFAGVNYQNIRQTGLIASEWLPNQPAPTQGMPLYLYHTGFSHWRHNAEWAPTIELRVEAKWQWTKLVTFKAGWTGLYMDGIARASEMILYEFDANGQVMGITDDNNRRGVFINGLTLGVEVNR